MARRAPPQPELTPEIVADEQKLWAAINEATLQLPSYQERRRKVIKAQQALKASLSDEAWGTYLAIEAASNHRHETEVTFLVRWAFDAARRFACRRRRGA